MRKKTRKARNKTKKYGFLIPNMAILLGVTGTLLYILFLTLTPDFEAELRAQFGSAFFDDFIVESPDIESGKVAQEAIIASYEPHFTSLSNEAIKRLEALFEEAYNEYELNKKEGTLDRVKLTAKYIQAGKLLEKQVDYSFYKLLNQMEQELKDNNLSTHIIEEVEATYLADKEEKKKELFERMRSKLQE